MTISVFPTGQRKASPKNWHLAETLMRTNGPVQAVALAQPLSMTTTGACASQAERARPARQILAVESEETRQSG